MDPLEIPTRETVDFVTSQIPAPPCRVLEIGCGQGAVASALMERGYQVTGVDPDAEVVAAARARGVPVIQTTWPALETDPVEAVLFTRSLHHMDDLTGALRGARRALSPGGLLVVEDFAFEETDDWTVAWFAVMLRLLRATGALVAANNHFVERILAAETAREAWRRHHDGHGTMHDAETMIGAIADVFGEVASQRAPYLYRYAEPCVSRDASGVVILENLLKLERHLGATRPDSLIGRRFVAHGPARHG